MAVTAVQAATEAQILIEIIIPITMTWVQAATEALVYTAVPHRQ